MYTLPHQLEFLSDAWLDEARAFLERELERGRGRFAGRPFSLSERFTDAPPHLGFAGGITGWSARFDGEKLQVSRAFDPDAELVAEGDYQAALTGAQRVGVLAPGAAAALARELETLYGKDALRTRGALAEPQARELLALLHDHLGRRTVENPDLAHRAARQGLTGKIREMEAQGYTVLERAISEEFAEEVRQATRRAMLAHRSEPTQRLSESGFSLQWLLYHGREFELLAQHPLVMTLIDASLGRGAVIASLSAIMKGPGPSAIPLHNDYALVPEPYPDFSMTGVGVWALEDWTVASGPTWLVPGSHRKRRAPRPGETSDDAVPIEMPKGSVVFFTQGVWHRQGDRTEPGERVTLHMHFNRGILRSLEPKRVDPQLLHRNAPRLGEMLGEDDPFDKIHEIGRDGARMAHMYKLQTFTELQKRALLAGSA